MIVLYSTVQPEVLLQRGRILGGIVVVAYASTESDA